MSPILWTDPAPQPCPYCGSQDTENLPIPAKRLVQWFCNCCGRGWTRKETSE